MRVAKILSGFACLFLLSIPSWAHATDDRVSVAREPGTPMGAIGMVQDLSNWRGESSGTGFLVSPCYVLTAAHAVDGDIPINKEKVVLFYVGQGDLGPGYGRARPFASYSIARPVIWGAVNHKPDKSTDVFESPNIYNDRIDDWALLELERCFGDEGYGYFKLFPLSTADMTRTGNNRAVSLAGLPGDRETHDLTLDPACALFGQVIVSGWDSDCFAVKGNSGGPVLADKPLADEAWPRAMGIVVRADREDPSPAIEMPFNAEAPTTVIPVSSFIADIAPYLPADPIVAEYLSTNPGSDRGYSYNTPERPIADLTAALSAQPNSAALLTLRGRWHEFADEEAAIADYTAALQAKADYAPALRARALVRFEEQENGGSTQAMTDAALADLNRIIEVAGGDKELHAARGTLLYEAYEYAAAVKDFDAVLEQDPGDESIRLQRAIAREAMGDIVGARADISVSLSTPLPPRTREGLVIRAMFNLRIGNIEQGFADVKNVLDRGPDFDAARGLAMLHLDQGDTRAALKALDESAPDPVNHQIGRMRAAIHHVDGDLVKAIPEYREGVKFDVKGRSNLPGVTADRARLANLSVVDPLLLFLALAESGQVAEARSVLLKMKSAEGLDPWASRLVQYLLGEASEASLLAEVETGPEARRGSKRFDCNFYLGAEAMLKGDKQKARFYIEEAVKVGFPDTVEFSLARRFLEGLGGPAYRKNS